MHGRAVTRQWAHAHAIHGLGCRLLYAYLSWSSKLYVADTPYSLVSGCECLLERPEPCNLCIKPKGIDTLPPCRKAAKHALAASRRVGVSLQPIAPCHVQIWGVLVVVGATGWWSIDSTRQGLALALAAAAVCPLAEIGLMNVGGLWHYPQPDAFGIVSW